jgi:hypothetical protein
MLSTCGGGSSAPIIEPVASNQVSVPVSEENPTSEVKVITQTIDGLLLDRPYLMRYPENPSQENYPVVFFFHDTGENGEQWLSKNPDVSDLIDDGKFIGIFPDGYENEWNIGVNNQYQNKAFSLYETEFVELVNSSISFVGGDTKKLIVISIPDYAFTPFGQNYNPTGISPELELYNDFAQKDAEENTLSYVYYNPTRARSSRISGF